MRLSSGLSITVCWSQIVLLRLGKNEYSVLKNIDCSEVL